MGRKAKEKNDLINGLQILEYPNRTIPKLIEELLEKNFKVIIDKDGYYVSGFYGLNVEKFKEGYALLKDTTEANVLVGFGPKGDKHIIKSFKDFVVFNSSVWGFYFKNSDDFKKPDLTWFSYMIDYGTLSISPK